MRNVGIVLAVYNGGTFLLPQLESIRQQGYQNWTLYVRDDCSHDASREIVKKFSKKYTRSYLLEDEKGNLGAKENFSSLIEAKELASFEYIALSDQDDVWQHDKLSVQLKLMLETEGEFPDSPILIYSNMNVVDQFLGTIHTSFMQYQGINHEKNNPLHVLLAQNFVAGCTVMVNRRLLDVALPIPDEAVMHDWWLTLCAAAFGKIEYIDQPLVKYRQHGSNEVGARSVINHLNPFKVNGIVAWLKGRENLVQSMHQARVLAERIKEYDPENENLKLIESYASLLTYPWQQRIKELKRNNIYCQSRARQYLMLSRLLTLPRQSDG